jgi:uncharacterized DUF497 family protein
MQICYDPAKRDWTLQERGLDFEDAPQVWAETHFDFEDVRNDYGEVRICSIGFLRQRMVMVVWTKVAAGRRIISMRKCNEKESRKYRPYLTPRL